MLIRPAIHRVLIIAASTAAIAGSAARAQLAGPVRDTNAVSSPRSESITSGAVPEPPPLALILIGATALLQRRRNHHDRPRRS
jgi:hypothetical protein